MLTSKIRRTRSGESKGDGDAATWLPPINAYRCAYVSRQIAVKYDYHLWVTVAERTAMAHVLSTCAGQDVPREGDAHRIVVSPTSSQSTDRPTTSAPTTPASDPGGGGLVCTTTSSGTCIRGGELCPEASYGRLGIAGDGNQYVCTGSPRPRWEPV